MTQALVLKRLRAARLRPSAARIGVLQVMEAAAPARLSAEDIYQAMLGRGTQASLGTVYRALHHCHEAGLLLRELDAARTWRYGIRSADAHAQSLQLVCPLSGRVVLVVDEALRERLLDIARDQGMALEGLTITIHAGAAAVGGSGGRPRPRLVARGGA